MALAPIVAFFLLFAIPSSACAMLAVRAFHRRALEPGVAKAGRASGWVLAAGVLPLAMVVLTIAVAQGAPLATSGGGVFVGYGIACAALGIGGAGLFRRAAEDPRRRLVRAAETVPMVIVMLNLVLVVNAIAQVPG